MEYIAAGFQKAEAAYPYRLDWDKKNIVDTLKGMKDTFHWGASEVICDAPGKAWEKAERGKSKSEIVNRLEEVMGGARKDILVVSPYFILAKSDIPKFGQAVKRGVRFRIFTNSLASTDAVPVVAMYRPVRKGLLNEGVERR
jgi:putative cardiolipin synthase